MGYTDKRETDILGVVASDGKTYCVDHAVEVLFDGDEEAFEEVDKGRDTTFIDKHGNRFDLIHDMSVSYAQSDDEFYPDGLTCEYPDCGAEIVAAQEDEEDEEDEEE
jgi:hypothetical protein